MPRSRVTAMLHHMAAGELLAMVDGAQLERIRKEDPRPELRAYTIAHEGEVQGNMLGVGNIVIRYLRDVIVKIGEKLRIGTWIYHGHSQDFDRKAIGEVVGKAAQHIDGVLTQVAAVWIYPDFRDATLDVASIEALVEFRDGVDGKATAIDVEEITGIALADSTQETPGFPGATLLATVQAFVQGKDSAMTLEEIKQALKDGGYSPSDVFERDALTADTAVQAALTESVEAATKTEREAKRAIQERLGGKLDKQREELDALKKESVLSKTSSVLDGIAKERELTDEQRKFVERRLNTFETDAEDEGALKGALNRHLDAELKEFKEYRELMGIKDDASNSDDSKGTPPDDSNGKAGGDSNDLSVPENNDFIPA